jgi:solute carrier family 25 protein 38
MQVHREDRYHYYHGLTQTVLTVWEVSTFLFDLVSFLRQLVPKERGIHGFLDGVSLRLSALFRKILSSAVGWAAYESLLVFARTRSQ